MAPPGGERLSYFALAAFQRWPIARGSSFPRRCQGPPVSGLPVYSYGDLKESMSRFSFWALAVAAPAGSDFLLSVFPPTI